MLSYDPQFAAIAASEHIDGLRKSYAPGRVPYRSDDADRDRNESVRTVLAPAFGTARNGCDPDLSQRAA
jgi:hypothetical protein